MTLTKREPIAIECYKLLSPVRKTDMVTFYHAEDLRDGCLIYEASFKAPSVALKDEFINHLNSMPEIRQISGRSYIKNPKMTCSSLDDILVRCLQPNPQKRLQRLALLKEELLELS